MNEWTRIVQSLGVPVAVMLGMAYALARVARWGAPRLDDLAEAHKLFLAQTVTNQQSMRGLLEQNHERLEEVHAGVGQIDHKVDQVLVQVASGSRPPASVLGQKST